MKKKDIKHLKREDIKRLMPLIILAVIVIIAVTSIIVVPKILNKQTEKREVITVSTLEKIIHINELSTFATDYKGIAKVMNKDNSEKVDYYAYYEATAYAGFDFTEIDVSVNSDEKLIILTIPKVSILDTDVNVNSLDLMFYNEKANTSTVTYEALSACEKDVADEISNSEAMLTLAKQNAENILTALVKPLVEQLDEEYKLIIKEGE